MFIFTYVYTVVFTLFYMYVYVLCNIIYIALLFVRTCKSPLEAINQSIIPAVTPGVRPPCLDDGVLVSDPRQRRTLSDLSTWSQNQSQSKQFTSKYSLYNDSRRRLEISGIRCARVIIRCFCTDTDIRCKITDSHCGKTTVRQYQAPKCVPSERCPRGQAVHQQ